MKQASQGASHARCLRVRCSRQPLSRHLLLPHVCSAPRCVLLPPASAGAHDLAMQDAGIHEFNLMEVRQLLVSKQGCCCSPCR